MRQRNLNVMSGIAEVKHPAASRGASLRNPAKPRTPFLPVASQKAFWRRRVNRVSKWRTIKRNVKYQNIFLKPFAELQAVAAGVINAGGTVKCINRFAVVLDADIVNVNERFAEFDALSGENFMPLQVFIQSERRGTAVDDEVNRMSRQDLQR